MKNEEKIKLIKKIVKSIDVVKDNKSKELTENIFNLISKTDNEQLDSILYYMISQTSNSFSNDVHIEIKKTLYTGSSLYIVQVFVLLRNMLIILKKYNFSEKEIKYIINNIIKFSNL